MIETWLCCVSIFYINYFSIKDVFYTFAVDKQIKD